MTVLHSAPATARINIAEVSVKVVSAVFNAYWGTEKFDRMDDSVRGFNFNLIRSYITSGHW